MTNGQKLLNSWSRWIASWVAFPEVPGDQALIAALWAMMTHFCPGWPATAYAHITGDGPGVGKTVMLEVLAALSLNAKSRVTLRPLEMVRGIAQAMEANGGKPEITYFCDEMEKLAHAAASDARSIITSGYKRGGKHGISVGQKSVEFDTYCAKAFASIGSLDDVFRSRAVMFRLTLGVPAKSWTDAALVRDEEAALLVASFREVMRSCVPSWTPPADMQGREREIWSPIWSMALALDLDAETMGRIVNAMGDMSEFKRTVEAKSYRDLRQEPKDQAAAYAETLLRDLAGLLPEPSKTVAGHISSVDAIIGLKALQGRPWRVYQGTGIDAVKMGAALDRFGLSSEPVRCEKGRGAKQVKGFHRSKVLAALAKLDVRPAAEPA